MPYKIVLLASLNFNCFFKSPLTCYYFRTHLQFVAECGGELTLYMTGNEDKLTDGRPTTEPLFSRGEEKDFPTFRKYSKVHYSEFIKYYTHDSKKMLIWQSIHNRHIFTVFDSHEQYNNRKKLFFTSPSYKDLSQKLKQQYKEGFKISSLSCDQTTGKFFVYMVEEYGTFQTIIQSTDPDSLFLDDKSSVTSCTVYNSTYYFVVTAGVAEFDGKDQEIFTRQSKKDVDKEIKKQKSRGLIITSVCYNVDAKECLVVMTESNNTLQEHAWFSEFNKRDDKLNEWENDLVQRNKTVYTIVFEDPSDGQFLCVMTCDNNRNGYQCRAASLYD